MLWSLLDSTALVTMIGSAVGYNRTKERLFQHDSRLNLPVQDFAKRSPRFKHVDDLFQFTKNTQPMWQEGTHAIHSGRREPRGGDE